MKRYYIQDIVITRIKDDGYLKSAYQANYLITYNHDIVGFSDTLKQAKKIAIDFLGEL